MAGTPLVGQTLLEARLRDRFHLNVAGVWERGAFEVGLPETRLTETSVLFLAGPPEALAAYDAEYGAVDPGGDAAEIEVLKTAGLDRATTVAVTTHDDDMNVYLTLYCRRLKPRLQILSRATLDRNVSTLYRAGADIVLSYASMGANAIFNLLRRRDLLLLGGGLDVFQVATPKSLVGRTLAHAGIRESSRCNVLAIVRGGKTIASPSAHDVLEAGSDLILIGDHRGEESFFKTYLG